MLFYFKYWIPIIGIYFFERELKYVRIKSDIFEFWYLYQSFCSLIFSLLIFKYINYHIRIWN